MKKTLEDLKANDQVKNATFDRRHGKFRVVLRSSLAQKLKYKTVRDWKSLAQDGNLDSTQEALEDAARNLLLEVHDAGLEAPPLEASGLEAPPLEAPGLESPPLPLDEFGDDGVALEALDGMVVLEAPGLEA